MSPVMLEPPFTRILNGGEVGIDVEGIGRALCRAQVGYVSLRTFNAMPALWRRNYGQRKQNAVDVIRKREGRSQNHVYDRGVHGVLIDMQAFDANATNKMIEWEPPASLCYPVAKGREAGVCQGLHETGGIPGNWAIDFCVPEIVGNGAPVLAVQDGWFVRFSGKDPDADTPDPTGAFGWSLYFQTRVGAIYYVTHLGRRAPFTAGQRITAGEVIGWVGDQDFRPDHVHYGVSHPLGPSDAKALITRVSLAPRVVPVA